MSAQIMQVIGLKKSQGVFTPDSGNNKGKDFPYDNLNIHVLVPFPASSDSVGSREVIYKLKGSHNFSRFSNIQLPASFQFNFDFDFSRNPPSPILSDIVFVD